MTLGEKIKFYRKNLKLSQEELAKKCNLSRNAIYNYESDKRAPTISILVTIIKNLNISLTDLLDKDANVKTYLIESHADDIEKEIPIKSDYEIAELYNKYFLKLFNWRTLNMTHNDYFQFILSLYPSNEFNHLTNADFKELSTLFYRLLTLKSHERNAIIENKVVNSNFLRDNLSK